MARQLQVDAVPRPKMYRQHDNPLTYLNDTGLLRAYRFHRNGIIFIFIRDRVETHDISDRGKPVSIELQVMATLRYLSSNSFQR